MNILIDNISEAAKVVYTTLNGFILTLKNTSIFNIPVLYWLYFIGLLSLLSWILIERTEDQ